MWIGHRKEIRKLTLETSAFESFYGGQFKLSTTADNAKLSCLLDKGT